ncbi:MAG: regulator of chromosome condensation, partial [Acidimicrobiaceae bacterium]
DPARVAFGTCPSGYTNVATDCNDGASTVRPMAPELCNDIDDDCDTSIDDGVTASPCYADADGDGYGAGAASTRCRDAARMAQGYCPVGYTNVATDCNDASSSIRPGGTESCNGLDDDCDGMTDELLTVSACLVDGDSDGYGAGATSTQCRDAARATYGFCPVGYTTSAGDCNDSNGTVRPMAAETCNGIDDDCDTTIDDGVLASPCYVDGDADNYGTGVASTRCRDATRVAQGECPVGYTDVATDCNDGNAAVRPGATETCNGIDDNCTMGVDEALTVTPCYADRDGDGYGAGPSSTQCRDATRAAFGFCPVAYSNLATDCNDASAAVRPGATETCNGIDDN